MTKISLRDHIETLKGFAFKSSWYTPNGGAPIIKVSNFGKDFVELSEFDELSTERAREYYKYKISINDVLIQTVGSWPSNPKSVVGKVVRCRADVDGFLLNQNIVKIIPKNTLVKRYLFYLLKNDVFKDFVLKGARGAANQASITLEDILSFEFELQNTEVQTLIASILSAYDDLIENNEKRIKNLEVMAQLLYIEWFVRFKFPGYEELKMVDSGTEYGMIPEGWEVKRLDEVIRIVRGRSYSSEQISDTTGDYYIVNLKSFNRGGGFRTDGAKYYSGQVSNDQLLKQGDIVVAVTDMTNDRAVIARPARIPNIITHKTTLSADVIKIAADKIPSSFIYYCLLDHRFTEATKHKANGANVLHLKPSAIGEYRALIPSIQLLHYFDALCKPSFDLIDKIMQQNADLEKMRDLLIPPLVTGKRELK